MRGFYTAALLLLGTFLLSCSGPEQQQTAIIKGQFSVSDSVDNSGDYSQIGLTIIQKDSANADADTLFHQLSDSTGRLQGTARITGRNRYPAFISRNGQNIGRFGVILADEDTVEITGELPKLQETLEISSREHDALEVFQRVRSGYRRVAQYARMGRIKGDSLGQELNKWSDLYWEVYEKRKGTLAAEMAVSESLRLLQGWNNPAMMEKVRKIQDEDKLIGTAAGYAKRYLADREGLEYTLRYLDTLRSNAGSEEVKMRVQMERIKLLYDSARVEQAKQQLEAFKEEFDKEKRPQEWVDNITYDLNYLSPGDTIPTFSFTLNSQVISRDSLIGTPYILEISTLANSLYQEQYERTVVIHSLYKNYGLQVVTIPLDNSGATVDGFFEERVRPWPVASANAFDRQELLEKFNIRLIPTRFLINRKGEIVRKYVGREYTDVIQDIQSLINEKEPAS